jgi:two-component system phosphate regulon sensor histidine kinase PhoR
MGLSLFSAGPLLAHGATMTAVPVIAAARSLVSDPAAWHPLVPLISLLAAASLFRSRARGPLPEVHQAILDSIADGVLILDAAGVVVDANPAALSSLNLPPAELVGRPVEEIRPGTPLGQALVALARADGAAEQEVRAGRRVTSLCAFPLPSAGAARAIILRDTSDQVAGRLERESLLRQVKTERERLELVLRNAGDVIMLVDNYGRILLGTRAARQLLPVERADRFPPALHAVVERARQENGPVQAEIELDDQIYEVTSTPLTGQNESSGLVVTLRDVTPFRRLTRFKDEFISTISHDMRSPLTSLLGYAQIAQMESVSEEQRQDVLARIEKAAWRLSNLVNQLLDLAALQAQVDYDLSPVQLEALAHAAVDDLSAAAEEKSLVIEQELDEPVMVEADPRLLTQVWLNLIDNAIKFTERGTITVRATTVGGKALGQVIDTGIGISLSDMPYIFEKFYRGKPPYGDGVHGTGLGLALVKAIVERHHGRVWAESQPGAGSTFSFTLPLLKNKE